MSAASDSAELSLQPSIPSGLSLQDDSFDFIGLKNSFVSHIDWNHSAHGKLWTYNLTYFEYLHQEDMDRGTGLALIHDFIDQMDSVRDGLEPFPISLRGINWIKFLSYHAIRDRKIDDALYAQYHILMDNLEYHLLGNHLLENAFSLLYGAYYFADDTFYTKAKSLLIQELNEQILSDGAHFELSPMYHQLMLFRLLDCINLLQNNSWKQDDLLSFLEKQASAMLGWLEAISYPDGSIPLLNDSAPGIAPSTPELLEYAARLGLSPAPSRLGESGYCRIIRGCYDCIVDVGAIGPDYIPGHAHADTFSFELRVDGSPYIVDTGISTYEANERRLTERGTSAHNTVAVAEKDSSKVWGSFRVADRAKIISLNETPERITATHDGYKKYGVLHTRCFEFLDDRVIISDTLSHEAEAKAYLHFDHTITPDLSRIKIMGGSSQLIPFQQALGYNHLVESKALEITFNTSCKVEILL